jgi:hypothetical protein
MDTGTLEARLRKLEQNFQLIARSRHKGFAKHGEAAEYLGISREKLRTLNNEGRGPPRTEDGRYPYEGLDAFNMGSAKRQQGDEAA